MTLSDLTIFLITHNEIDRLPRCLDSCAFAGRVVVVDSGSTDGSIDYCRERGCDVTVTGDWPGFGMQKNRALDRCESRWVFNIDADEWISPQLADEIEEVMADPRAATAYELSRRCRFNDRLIKCCGWWPHRVVRLWQRERGRYRDQRVHETIDVTGETARLVEPLDHEPYRDFGHLIQKNVAYARAAAEQMVRDGRRSSLWKVFTSGTGRFLRDWLLKSGIFAGGTGFAIAAAQGFGAFAKHAMVWLDQQKTRHGLPSTLLPTACPPAETHGWHAGRTAAARTDDTDHATDSPPDSATG